MTALIYKAALPTYTSAEALTADAGETLLLNDAGTAYELLPGQSSASVPTVHIVGYVDGAPNGGLAGELNEGVLDPSAGPYYQHLTMSYGPIKINPGGKMFQLYAFPAMDAKIRGEMFVSNAAATQSLLTYFAGPFVPLVEGVLKTMGQADWTTPSLTGSDLSIAADGSVMTTAGGVFWVNLITYLIP